MSATSEELAAQAEHLQSSIAYFKVERAEREAAMNFSAAKAAVESRPGVSSTLAAPKPPASFTRPAAAKPAAQTVKPATAPAANGKAAAANGKANGSGFRLDLNSGGPDAQDADFERY
jgi:methyl-accepting chemotaxis protein